MALQMTCLCGYVLRGGDEDEFWEVALTHVALAHPDQASSVTREDILAQAELV